MDVLIGVQGVILDALRDIIVLDAMDSVEVINLGMIIGSVRMNSRGCPLL